MSARGLVNIKPFQAICFPGFQEPNLVLKRKRGKRGMFKMFPISPFKLHIILNFVQGKGALPPGMVFEFGTFFKKYALNLILKTKSSHHSTCALCSFINTSPRSMLGGGQPVLSFAVPCIFHKTNRHREEALNCTGLSSRSRCLFFFNVISSPFHLLVASDFFAGF